MEDAVRTDVHVVPPAKSRPAAAKESAGPEHGLAKRRGQNSNAARSTAGACSYSHTCATEQGCAVLRMDSNSNSHISSKTPCSNGTHAYKDWQGQQQGEEGRRSKRCWYCESLW